MTLTLRPDQEQVVRYRGGYLAVPAVPGAGKTTVLAALASDLIAGGRHEPGRILVVTYTNSGVGNFRTRIGDMLAERGLSRNSGYEVRTLHSLAMSVVRERPEALRLTDQFSVLDGPRQERVLGEIARRWMAWHRAEWEAALKPDLPPYRRDDALRRWEKETTSLFLTMIKQFKARGIGPAEAVHLAADLPGTSFLKWAAEVYGLYQAELGAQGVLDYDDLITGAYRLIRSDVELLARLRARWTYLFEDEAQDSTPLQEQILLALAGPGGNLVRVGDPNQSIMSTFTAADPALFRAFCRRPDVDVRPLVYAGRSSPDIIDLANRLVEWAVYENPEPACRGALVEQMIQPVPEGYPQQNPRPGRYTINTRQFDTYSQELETLARWADLVRQQYPDRTVAVLLPTNNMVDALAMECEKLGAPCIQLRRDLNPEAYKTVSDLLALVEFLADPLDGGRLVLALGRLLGLKDPEHASFAPFLHRARLEELFFPLDGTEPFADLHRQVPEAAGWADLDQWLYKVRGWLEESQRVPPDSLVLLLAQDLGLQGEERAVAHQVALHIRRLLYEEPAAGLYEAAAWARIRSEALSRAAATFYDRRGFKPEPGVVYAVTCHSAKGLEWDTCFVGAVTRDAGTYPSSLEDWIPSELWYLQEDLMNPTALAVAELDELRAGVGRADPIRRAKADVVNERLRLLYVAATRARENLVVSCYRTRERGGREAKVQPAAAFWPLARLVEVRRRDSAGPA